MAANPGIKEVKTYIMDRYPDDIYWHEKVRNMSNKQAYAIYNHMRDIDYKNEVFERDYHQITIFEYLMEKEAENETMA